MLTIVAKNYEKLLKAAAFALLLCGAAFARAEAAETAANLLVGSIRDASGDAVAAASVRALDAAGATLGSDRSAADGTFAIAVAAPAATLRVDCAHCRSLRLELAGRTNVAVIVTRYAALQSDVPSPRDIAALPYGRIVDDLGLVPFALPSSDGANVSDRGLGGGRGLVLDAGVPLVDLASGTSALADFPDRYVNTIALQRHDGAFRYGSYAAGGIFSLDRSIGDASSGSVDAGGNSALVLAPRFGAVSPAYGASADAGVSARRADVDGVTDFAGGTVRAGAGTGSETASADVARPARNFDLEHLAYATASRRYRTFFDLAAANAANAVAGVSQRSYRASYFDLDARIEHPGPVALTYGASIRHETAHLGLYEYASAPSGEFVNEKSVYVQAATGSVRAAATGGLGLSDVGTGAAPFGYTTRFTRVSLLPSFSASVNNGAGAYLRLGYSQALRVPTLTEAVAGVAAASDVQRSELTEAAAGFDTGGRLKAEAIAFREDTRGAGAGRLDGAGASLVWQIAPLVSVRLWSLHDSSNGAPEPYYSGARSRHVLWTTYANGDGLRFDAVAQHDTSTAGDAIVLDGDVYVPLQRFIALDAGSTRRSGVRRYYVALRSR